MNALVLKREIETLLGLKTAEAVLFWQSVATLIRPATPPSPVAMPYPNISNRPGQSADDRFDGRYLLTSVQHRYSRLPVNDLFECIIAAAIGDASASKVQQLWLRVKGAVEREPAPTRAALGHELVHTIQQRGK